MDTKEKKIVCKECGSPAEFIEKDMVWRHMGSVHEDEYFQQTFCTRYGYPISVMVVEITS